jgi:undecaprenyl-diphosphatase
MYKYIILGIIQGLTEFLPVSSSGHLVIAQKLFSLKGDYLLLDIVLHAGTLLALILFFYQDITRICSATTLKGLGLLLKYKTGSKIREKETDFKTGVYILIATLITALIVYLGKDFFERLFSSAKVAVAGLLLTGIVLLLSGRFTHGKRDFSRLNFKDGLFIGIAQAIAVVPGLSRSGLTISTALFRNVERSTAFKFSFLVSIPAVSGALILKLNGIKDYSSAQGLALGAGFLAAFLSGLLALKILKKVIQQAKFAYFGYYCLTAAILSWLLLKI